MDSAELSKLRKQKLKAEETNNLKELSKICNEIGEYLTQYGQYQEAIAEHERDKQICEALNDKIGQAVGSRKIGECHCLMGNFRKALKLQNQYLVLAKECENKVEIQRALATLGDTYYNQAEAEESEPSRLRALTSAEEKFKQALRVCEELRVSASLSEKEHAAMRGRLLLNLGLVHDLRKDVKGSAEYLEKALNLAKQWHLEEEQLLCHFSMGDQALRRGEFAQAMKSLHLALTLAHHLHNKPRQKEVFFQLAIASLGLNNIQEAKHFLKKAYKILPTFESEKCIKIFKAVDTIRSLREKLAACEGDDGAAFRLQEKLGDAFSDIGVYSDNYTSAVEHYRKMVECGERQGLGSKKLIPAYVSLAQAYADNHQIDLAINCYKKEIELRGNDHAQICRTWLNIAELEEKRGDSYKNLSKTYVSAFTHAKKAHHPKLQIHVLRDLLAVQSYFKERRHQEQTQARLTQIRAKCGIDTEEMSEDEVQDEEDKKSDDEDEDDVHIDDSGDVDSDSLSISDLTESDEENAQDGAVGQKVHSARIQQRTGFGKRSKLWRNAKGETKLHVACIDGDLQLVKTLLREHNPPVNERDNCGWTPLHEASNHGFTEIVEALIDAGANMNDRGGQGCNGVTPLIDAAQTGNAEVMQVLIQRGANVLAKSDDGRNALKALKECVGDVDSLDEDELTQYNSIVRLLQEKMGIENNTPASITPRRDSLANNASRHQPTGRSSSSALSSQQASTTPSTQSSQKRQPASTSINDDDFGSDDDFLYHNLTHGDLDTCNQNAAELYRNTIMSHGSSSQRRTLAKMSKPGPAKSKPTSAPKSAFLSQDEVGDDWLVNDVRLPPTKRKRQDRERFLSSGNSRGDRRQKRARLTSKRRVIQAGSDSDEVSDNRTHRLASHRGETASPIIWQSDDSMHFVADLGTDSDLDNEDSLPVLAHTRRLSDTPAPVATQGPYATQRTMFDQGMQGSAATQGSYSTQRTMFDQGMQGPVATQGSYSTQRTMFDQGMPPTQRPQAAFHRSDTDGNRRSDLEAAGSTPANQISPVSSLSASSSSSRLSRVKVRIEGAVFLVPVPAFEEKTVRWLSEEASQRYCSHFGRKPFMTLSSADGAILSADDILSAVLSPDEVLEGSVLGWDEASLSDKYSEACKTLGTVRYKNISALLKEAETSHKLSLSGLGLRCSILLPITRALAGHSSLQQLLLPDNHLGDSGVEALTTALKDITTLTDLDLAGNNITAQGLGHLASLYATGTGGSASSVAHPLQMLKVLDLSHNPLGNDIVTSLCQLLKGLPSLTSLSLSSCHLTVRLFEQQRQALASSLKESSMEQLDISHNDLGTLGVELLLRCLSPKKLTDLDLGHTCSDTHQGHIALHLRSFINQGCVLRNLSLENCNLDVDDLQFVCSLPRRVPTLQKLNVSVNKSVTTQALERLLSSSVDCATSQLQHLQAESCSVTSPLCLPSTSSTSVQTSSSPTFSSIIRTNVVSSDQTALPSPSSFLQTLQGKLACEHPIRYLSLTCEGMEEGEGKEVKDVWVQRWGQSANVVLRGNHLVLWTAC